MHYDGPYVYVKFDSQHSGPVSKVEKEALFDL